MSNMGKRHKRSAIWLLHDILEVFANTTSTTLVRIRNPPTPFEQISPSCMVRGQHERITYIVLNNL